MEVEQVLGQMHLVWLFHLIESLQDLQTRTDTAAFGVQRNLELKAIMFVLLNNVPMSQGLVFLYLGLDINIRDLLRLLYSL